MASHVITIDGPTASGKGAVARQLALRLGWHYLDSGILYRELARQHHSHPHQDLLELMNHWTDDFPLQLSAMSSETKPLRSEEIGQLASAIARQAEIRQALIPIQRRCQLEPGLVTDGRDMGTVIFPEAELKIFLTASTEIRAMRRKIQLQEYGQNVNLQQLEDLIHARDVQDKKRSLAPMTPHPDSVFIDNTHLSIGRVADLIEAYYLELAVKS